jgi:hypothetical protein
VVIWPTAQKPLQALCQLQLQLIRRDPPWGVGVLDGVAEPDRVSDDPEVPDVLQGPAFGVSGPASCRLLLLELAASLEEPGHVCKSAVGGMAVAELAEVVPPLARLEVVMAEVGLAEAALVGLAALEVAGQAAAAELAAAELAAAKAKRQLVLHRRSCSFYMEAHTRYHRYHRIAQSLFFVVCSTHHFYLSLLASSFSFYDAQLCNLPRRLEY